MSNVIGELKPWIVSEILGTGYHTFDSDTGMHGLAKVRDKRLDVLALDADSPGTGQLRDFITKAKVEYSTICIWLDMNPILGPILERYGFTPETEIQPDGEVVRGWRWDAAKT